MRSRTSSVVLFLAIGILAMFAVFDRPAQGQGVQRIAVIVNDEVISVYDLEQRIRLLLSTSQSRPSAQVLRRMQNLALESLIDESLQVQEAGRLSIRVDEAEIEQAIAIIEQQNGLPEGGLGRVVINGGANMAALTAQLRAQIAWTKVIAQRLRPRVIVGQDEVDNALARIRANEGRAESLVSEIFLSAEGVAQKRDVRRGAEDLVQQLRAGSPFPDVARQVSQGLSAPEGGDIGWVGSGQLAPELDAVLVTLAAGEISDPIEVVDGFYILHLRDQRRGIRGDLAQIKVSLKQIFLSFPENASQETVAGRLESARSIAGRARGCDDFQAIIDELESPESGDLGTITLGDTPENFREAIAALKIGEASEPVQSATGVRVFMVCDREEPEIPELDRASIENKIGQTRLEMLARRYLRDLRRDAVVEFRL